MSDRLLSPTYTDIERAAQGLQGKAHQTPVMTSRMVNEITQAQVFFKCENLQKTGSFKFRGAYYTLSQLPESERKHGVIAYSSGNHAQAIALAGALLEIPTTLVMPENAPKVKFSATEGYGANIVTYDPTQTRRETLTLQLAKEQNLNLIPPYDHPQIIAGQGTTAKELIEEVGDLDYLLVCCGGGGLLSGCAIAAKTLSPHCHVVGVEPALGDDATRSFYTQTLQTVNNPQTIADGARTPSLGNYTFPLVLRHVDQMVTVSENSIRRTLRFLWERLKLVVEPTGTLAAAALLEGQIQAPGAKIGVILSGGNVDLEQLPFLLAIAQ
ncbi:threo-3-hydroxy-L-aspartate ammonia-lyase [Roseofilum sp. Guam]|uniref:threo-3-hydroxy-L-aspartate ammonia-lyase n=1 Tax=Roseofilum sp. Guam TaxID=2821502 RepID=UPI001B295793|nr:threo-3-hydroxy-L-aspartate ammonia-lyase [Roseofilum sp. Guam]MBP0031133.1 threo-3-hydroxy-L-aspartate ammonia-lyase [Roseofilum sp. Guam]